MRYYRLKIVDQNGGYSYSEVRPVVFGDDVKWQVYPNPSPSVFFLQFQAGDGEKIAISIYDASGRAVLKTEAQANGFIQKFPIDLSRFAPGLYLLEASNGAKKEAFRLVRQ